MALDRLPILLATLYVASLALPLEPRIPLVLLLAGMAFAVSSDQSARWRNPLGYSLVAYLAISLLSLAFSTYPATGLDKSLSLVPAVFLFLIVAAHGRERRNARTLAVALPATAAVIALVFTTMALLHPQATTTAQMQAAGYPHFGVPNDLLFLAVLAPLALALGLDKNWMLRTTGAVSLALIIVAIITFRSRGTVLVLVVGLLAFVAIRRPRLLLPVGAGLLVLIVGLDALQSFALSERFSGVWGARLPLWEGAWKMFLDAPLLGHGPGTFETLYDHYVNHDSAPEWAARDLRKAPWPHQIYLEALAERGLLGATALLAVLATALDSAWRGFRTAGDASSRDLHAALFGSLIAIALAGLFELSLVRHWLQIVLATECGLLVSLVGRASLSNG